MNRLRALNMDEVMARLRSVTIFELRQEWRHLHRMSPPKRLSRDLLIRGIAYKLQEAAYGGLTKAELRQLIKLGTARIGTTPPITELSPGSKIVRDWHGATHVVLVQKSGFEWKGKQYKSLTAIAREITGVRWSGPRFFGLYAKRAGSPSDD